MALPRAGSGVVRVWLENARDEAWWSFDTQPTAERSVVLVVSLDGRVAANAPLRHDVGFEQRVYFTVTIDAPPRPGTVPMTVDLVEVAADGRRGDATRLIDTELVVDDDGAPWWRRVVDTMAARRRATETTT